MSERDQEDAHDDLQLGGKEPEEPWIFIQVNGQTVRAQKGVNLSTVLWNAGNRTLRYTYQSFSPRGIFCGMGVCFDCLVTINGEPKQRACLTIVQPGMRVQTEDTWPQK